MSVPYLNYHHLHYFWAVAHDGQLSQAARRLHIGCTSRSRRSRPKSGNWKNSSDSPCSNARVGGSC